MARPVEAMALQNSAFNRLRLSKEMLHYCNIKASPLFGRTTNSGGLCLQHRSKLSSLNLGEIWFNI